MGKSWVFAKKNSKGPRRNSAGQARRCDRTCQRACEIDSADGQLQGSFRNRTFNVGHATDTRLLGVLNQTSAEVRGVIGAK
jgi:hypothetical protein